MDYILQRTTGWYRSRLGKITGSAVGDIMPSGKSAPFTKTGYAYLNTVVAELLIAPTIYENDTFLEQYIDEVSVTSKAMRIGTEREDEALQLYSEITGGTVTATGSKQHPLLLYFASSPDGVIYDNSNPVGCIEIKCPKPNTFIEYLLNVHNAETLLDYNPKYYWQCVSHMAVTGAGWCDFIVYCPYMAQPLHIVRIHRNQNHERQLLERVRVAYDYITRQLKIGTFETTVSNNAPIDDVDASSASPTLDALTSSDDNKIAKADMKFIIEALNKLVDIHPSENLRQQNFVRRCKLLTWKLNRKLTPQTNLPLTINNHDKK